MFCRTESLIGDGCGRWSDGNFAPEPCFAVELLVDLVGVDLAVKFVRPKLLNIDRAPGKGVTTLSIEVRRTVQSIARAVEPSACCSYYMQTNSAFGSVDMKPISRTSRTTCSGTLSDSPPAPSNPMPRLSNPMPHPGTSTSALAKNGSSGRGYLAARNAEDSAPSPENGLPPAATAQEVAAMQLAFKQVDQGLTVGQALNQYEISTEWGKAYLTEKTIKELALPQIMGGGPLEYVAQSYGLNAEDLQARLEAEWRKLRRG